MLTLSLCMIVKNNQATLERCLDCVVDLVDEIVIVDLGSTDTTKKIAAQYTDKIYSYTEDDNLSSARNFSFSKATKDYILWLDPSDVVDPPSQALLRIIKSSMDAKIDVVMMQYHTAFDSCGNPVRSCNRERIVKRTQNYRWTGTSGKYMALHGNIIVSKACVRQMGGCDS